MALAEAAGRIAATVVAMIQTRLELAAVEMEEESQRWLGYLLMSLLALFLSGVAIVLLALCVIILFWDSYRIASVLGLTGVFALAALLVGAKLRAGFCAKGPLLAATVAELRKDIAFVKNAGHQHEH